jgi:hypothetical protein
VEKLHDYGFFNLHDARAPLARLSIHKFLLSLSLSLSLAALDIYVEIYVYIFIYICAQLKGRFFFVVGISIISLRKFLLSLRILLSLLWMSDFTICRQTSQPRHSRFVHLTSRLEKFQVLARFRNYPKLSSGIILFFTLGLSIFFHKGGVGKKNLHAQF